MCILGVDPGTIVMGYGVIDESDDELALVSYGALSGNRRSPVGERLSFLYHELEKVIRHEQPEAMAIEQPFVGNNVKSAFAIGKAQAIAMLAAANHNIPSFEYTPAQVKRQVTNYGASSKGQVQQMVKLQLGLDEVPQPEDAADALAVAICHQREIHLKNLLDQQGEG